MSMLKSPLASRIGIVLTRVVVPLWVLTGAIFKLIERTPKLLPKNIWTNANDWGIDLYVLLATLIALEFLAVGVMLLMTRFARAMAIFMLAAFCAILIGEIAVGNTSCGCLGAISPSPWVMLAIDAALLVAVVLFRPRYDLEKPLPRGELIAAAVWIVSGFAVSAAVVLPERGRTAEGTDNGEVVTTPGGNATQPPVPDRPGQRPPALYVPDVTKWAGRAWKTIPLAHYMKSWPANVEQGRQYIIFFSRSCDHCQEMLEMHFYDEPPAPTLLVAIPERKTGFDRGAELEMVYCTECVEHAELPIGTDWLITAPIVVAIEDGIVQCAQEGGDEEHPPEDCLIWHPRP